LFFFFCFFFFFLFSTILRLSLRYPHLSGGEPLRAVLCNYTGCINENLMVTNGSDDALILICQTYLKHDALGMKHVLTPTPTYEHFCVNALGTFEESGSHVCVISFLIIR
jgi:histidinol-phosphate/aromatic aminotransferase/cobyric acid decarboxylase-like protein